MLILGQKSCISGPTIFKILQPNWHECRCLCVWACICLFRSDLLYHADVNQFFIHISPIFDELVLPVFSKYNGFPSSLKLHNRTDINLYPFPELHPFWFLEKTTLRKNCISGALLKIQLTRNFPTNVYISQKLSKWKSRWWKPCNGGTRCTSNSSQLEKEIHPMAGLTAWLELQLLENLFLSMPSKLSSLPDIMLPYSSYVLLWLGLGSLDYVFSIFSQFCQLFFHERELGTKTTRDTSWAIVNNLCKKKTLSAWQFWKIDVLFNFYSIIQEVLQNCSAFCSSHVCVSLSRERKIWEDWWKI